MTFCLLHNSGQGPAGWKSLVDELEQRGHNVLTPAFEIDRTPQAASKATKPDLASHLGSNFFPLAMNIFARGSSLSK